MVKMELMTKSLERAMVRKLARKQCKPNARGRLLQLQRHLRWHLLSPNGAVTEPTTVEIDGEADDVVDQPQVGP